MSRWLALSAAVPVAFVACSFALAACAPEGAPTDEEEAASDESHLEVRPGDLVEIDGVRAIAPEPGMGVWAEVLDDSGKTHALHLRTDVDSNVLWVHEHEDAADTSEDPSDDANVAAEAAGEATAASGPGPCSDTARNVQPWRWTKRYDWFFDIGTTPSDVSKTNTEAALKRAIGNITGSHNSCGMADQVSATNLYRGHTTVGTQVAADATCKPSGNGKNTVGFGDLPTGILGLTCVWYDGNGAAIEADVRLNKGDQKWIASMSSSCKNRFSIEAVATHEFGHVFGLGHVSESKHGNLTMSPMINGACENSEATLGKGDVLGLRAIY